MKFHKFFFNYFSYLQFFDEVKIEDPRVAELCAKTTEPSPYAILLTCLQRYFLYLIIILKAFSILTKSVANYVSYLLLA